MPLLNVDQAAERLGTSPRFIRRLIAERRIAFAKLGKHVRIDSADLDAFAAAGRVAAAVPIGVPERRDRRARGNAYCAGPSASPETPVSSRRREDDREPNVAYKTVNRGV